MDIYRAAKEASVSDLRGGTLAQIVAVSLVPWAGTVLLEAAHAYGVTLPWPLALVWEWTALVLPPLLATTVCAAPNEALSMVCSLLSSAVLLVHWSRDRPRPRPRPHSRRQPKPTRFITVYRAHMMLMTILCILAVDFPCFPRTLAKTEAFGLSLMDLGVGSFVFSWGLVSARILLTPRYVHNQATGETTTAPSYQHLAPKTVRKTWPLLLLGLVRVVAVKGAAYPEHMGEYGVHWNFFATLSLLPVLASLVAHIRPSGGQVVSTALLLLAAHEAVLSSTPVGGWALAPLPNRVTDGLPLLTQNKEGIVSLPGYVVLFLLGLHAGLAAFSPGAKRSLALLAVGYSLAFSVVLTSDPAPYAAAFDPLVAHGAGPGWGVSRRLANAGYVLFVAAYNTAILALYVATQAALTSLTAPATTTDEQGPEADLSQSSETSAAAAAADDDGAPGPALTSADAEVRADLLDALNRHAMTAFLTANLLTGGINLLVQTWYQPSGRALAIIAGYSMAITGGPYVWDVARRTRIEKSKTA